MRLMDASVYATYGALCRRIRARGRRLGFFELSEAADLALSIHAPDADRVALEKQAARLDLLPEDFETDQ